MPVTDTPAPRPPLDPSRLVAPPGWTVEILPETPSTNAVLAERARAGVPEGTVVTTEHQTAGRGRLDRGWETPTRAAVTLSVLLRPALPAGRWPWLPLLTGLAVTRTLREQGYDAGVKWPNDVLLRGDRGDEQKVCGILVEMVDTPDGPAAVVGIGVNTSQTPAELPVPTATSLEIAGAAPVDRTEVLGSVLRSLRAAYDAWLADPGGVLEPYTAASVTLGRQVTVELPVGAPLVGTAERIDHDGRLVVRTDAGETTVGAGDVVHARLTGR